MRDFGSLLCLFPDVENGVKNALTAKEVAEVISSNQKQIDALEWSGFEYEPRAYSQRWFITLGGIALALVLFGIVAKSWFFITFVVLAFFVILMYAKRAPRELTFSISSSGVGVGNQFYQFSQLKSFYIIESREFPELSLETSKHLQPFIRIPLEEVAGKDIKELLGRFLPLKEHPEFFTDQIARKIGF